MVTDVRTTFWGVQGFRGFEQRLREQFKGIGVQGTFKAGCFAAVC